MICYRSWKDFELGLKQHKTIDDALQRQMNEEVLKRLLICVQFLGAQSLAFRGDSEELFQPNNGNFLKLIESIAKFDPILREHLRRIQCEETRSHYLSSRIQNELIILLSEAVKENILSMIREAKYFSIIIDCTPDKSYVEQMTIIFRFVVKVNGKFEIKEHFMGFVVANDATGEGLTKTILKAIDALGLSLSNCRSNMKGKHVGVQARIREIEPRAFYVPCSSHSLNLVINDGAQCSQYALSFFESVQSIYNFFSRSNIR